MSTPFLAQVYIFSFGFPPKGYAQCNGQLLPINQNQALFSLLGTTYGGDGRVNFGLPNLQGRVPMHLGNGHVQGERGGEETHTLSTAEIAHSHPVAVYGSNANSKSPVGNAYAYVAGTQTSIYSTSAPDSNMGGGFTNTGGGGSHNNIAPYLTLNMCIALQGIFPSRN